MKRTALFLVSLAAGGLTLWAQAASVQSGRTTTLPPMYHDDEQGRMAEGAMNVIIRNAPKSPVKDSRTNVAVRTASDGHQRDTAESNPEHFSIGDKLVFSTPLYSTKDLNHKGAAPIATFYAEATVIKGDTYANMLVMLHSEFVFATGDHITVQGVVTWTGAERGAPITGGTGAYEGVRGTDHHIRGIDNLVIKY